jgi:hypothetical protein
MYSNMVKGISKTQPSVNGTSCNCGSLKVGRKLCLLELYSVKNRYIIINEAIYDVKSKAVPITGHGGL